MGTVKYNLVNFNSSPVTVYLGKSSNGVVLEPGKPYPLGELEPKDLLKYQNLRRVNVFLRADLTVKANKIEVEEVAKEITQKPEEIEEQVKEESQDAEELNQYEEPAENGEESQEDQSEVDPKDLIAGRDLKDIPAAELKKIAEQLLGKTYVGKVSRKSVEEDLREVL